MKFDVESVVAIAGIVALFLFFGDCPDLQDGLVAWMSGELKSCD